MPHPIRAFCSLSPSRITRINFNVSFFSLSVQSPVWRNEISLRAFEVSSSQREERRKDSSLSSSGKKVSLRRFFTRIKQNFINQGKEQSIYKFE